ncbi:50S ribosomal protein L2 [Candidatus Uhrbacteria bacterium]|nr:50S ribosomal protein L2 [Candidatus Uhrbacteria bacterium]
MPVKKYRPLTAARRLSSVDTFEDITAHAPLKRLTINRKRSGGRTNGKITIRHRGGGAARRVRIIDSHREKFDVPARIVSIEYDPNRGARLALVQYVDGEQRYIIAPSGVVVGQTIVSSKERGDMKPGNRFPLSLIPVGIEIHDVEIFPGKGGTIAKGAGAKIQLMAIEDPYAHLRLPSGEIRLVRMECMATIGSVSNQDHRLIRWGKAGRSRHRGIRPIVRGKVMNPVDHPHGGGEARNPIGLKHPKTPQGKPALGVKTRREKPTDKFILQRRPPGRFSKQRG